MNQRPNPLPLNCFRMSWVWCSACMNVCAQMCVQCLRRPEEGRRGPGTGVADDCDPPGGCWELNSCPPEDQQVLLNCCATSPAPSEKSIYQVRHIELKKSKIKMDSKTFWVEKALHTESRNQNNDLTLHGGIPWVFLTKELLVIQRENDFCSRLWI